MADNQNTLSLTLKVNDDGSVIIDTVAGKIKGLEATTASAGGSSAGVLSQLKGNWLAVTGAVTGGYLAVKGGIDVFQDLVNTAEEANAANVRVGFSAEKLGYDFNAIKPYVDAFAESMLKTTRVSDELAKESLAKILEFTPDIEAGMNGVRLATDMTAKKFGDMDSNLRYVGMAMNGNVEILGRWVPELKNLDEKLGKNATSAEKTAYALDILNKKFGGAAAADIKTYAGQVAQLKNEFDELKESAGGYLTTIARGIVRGARGGVDLLDLIMKGPMGNIPSTADIKGENAARRAAQEQARIAREAKQHDDELVEWKSNQEQRQAMNYHYAMQEWQIKKNAMALIDAEEFIAIEKAKKYGADIEQIKTTFHLKRLEQIKTEKQAEMDAALSIASMWKSHYDERISKENEIIGLIKGSGVETTIGARFEFANVEEQFAKIAEKAGSMLTGEEFEKLKAAYAEKLKGIMPLQGGEWEEIQTVTGKEMGQMGPRNVWGTDWRWKEAQVTEEQRRIEALRESSLQRIEGMGRGAAFSQPKEIIDAFDEPREKAVELQKMLQQLQQEKLSFDTTKLVEAMKDIDDLEGKLIDLIKGDWKIQVGVEILGDELIRQIESRLGERVRKNQSVLPAALE